VADPKLTVASTTRDDKMAPQVFAKLLSLKGGFYFLNFFRAVNIAALFCNMAGTWAMIVMTAMTNNFYFFDAASHFSFFCVNLFIVLSEMQLWRLKNFFNENWPVFGDRHGLTWLGFILVAFGCHMLGHLNKPQFAEKTLGSRIWGLVFAAGVLSLIAGCFSIICSFVWQDRQAGITARMVRADGEMAGRQNNDPTYYSASTRSGSTRQTEETKPNRITQIWKKSPMGGGRKLNISKPIPHDPEDVERGDSWADRRSPIAEGAVRPPTEMHPAYHQKKGHATAYSVADMPRF